MAPLSLPHLRSLDVTSCKLLSGSCLAAVAARSPRLERLCFRGVGVDDTVLASLASSCPLLAVLEFGSGNPFGGGIGGTFSSSGLLAVTSSCKHLTHLVAAGSGARVVDADLAACLPSARSLRTLDISGNTAVGNATLAALGAHCAHLTHLNAFRCGGITGAGLLSLLPLPSLEVVDISHCLSVRLEDLSEFLLRCQPLKRLIASGLPFLKDSSVSSQFLAALPPRVLVQM